MLKKLILGFAALFLVLIGSLILMMGYVFNHPDSIFSAISKVTNKFTEGQPYEEKQEFFLQGMKEVRIQSRRCKIEVLPYSGNTMKIELAGKIPRFENGPYIQQIADTEKSEQVDLQILQPMASSWVHLNVNGQEMTESADAHLTAKIYLPLQYVGLLKLTTGEASVDIILPKDKYYEFDFQSENGKIDNQISTAGLQLNPGELGKIQVVTTSGDITVKNR